MNAGVNILFLYSELAGYFLACVNALVENHPVKVRIIRWDVNKEAPFKFKFNDKIEVLDKGDFSKAELEKNCINFQPDLVYSAGWMDKDYMKIVRRFKKQGIPVIAGVDSPWRGNLKQKIASLISPFYIKPLFTHIWGAGLWQYEFARRLGFPQDAILNGLYCADLDAFMQKNDTPLPRQKTILYVGRFLEYKGIQELYDAFSAILKEQPDTPWQLMLIGNGPLKDSFTESEKIIIKDFIQPDQLANVMQQAGAFCLPSRYEPWGVVVHEAVAAACPMIVSDGVSAGTAFVKHGYNGYVFESGNTASLKKALLNIMGLSKVKRQQMGERSVQLALQNTPEIWAETLLSVLKE